MKNIEYKDFSNSFHKNEDFSKIPFKGHFELTYRCNLKCNYCFVACFNNKEHLKNELTFPEICIIIDQIVDAGCLWLTFSGGEPFSRSDFLKIYLYAKRKGLIITIFTNAIYLTKKIVEQLLTEPPFCIEVTLNGITKGTYEKISGVSGTFKQALDGIKNAVSKGIPVKIKTQALTINYHELSLIEDFANSLGVLHSFDFAVYPEVNKSKEPCKYRLSEDKFKRFFLSKTPNACEDVLCNEEFTDDEHPIYCASGINSFFILATGSLVFCNLIREPSYSLKEHLFYKAFNKLYPYMRALTYNSESKCRKCKIKDSCRRCPGIALLENNDLESPVKYYCSLASYE